MKSYQRTLTVITSALKMGMIAMVCGTCQNATALDFPGPAPGSAVAEIRDGILHLENNVLQMDWRVANGSLQPLLFKDKLSGKTLSLDKAECFQLLLANTPLPGTRNLRASELRLVGSPGIEEIHAEAKSPRLADRQPGRAIAVKLASADGIVEVTWQAVLRDGSSYVRQEISCQTKQKETAIELAEVIVWDLAVPGAEVQGVVDGSPVVANTLFFAAEHPMSKNCILDQAGTSGLPRLKCSYIVGKSLQPGQPQQFRSLVGVTPEGQLRRGFLYYLERERAQPYRQLLHYNNGYEIGCEYWIRKQSGKPGEAEAFRRNEQQIWLAAIEAFGRELVANRQVVVDSFVHDFGWDDENLLWQFHEGYPEGFRPAQQAAAKYGSQVGVWFSPFGSYGDEHKHRLELGRKQGFETYRNGLTLAGPRYFARFDAACQGLVDMYGVNCFKFDGFGAHNNQPGALDCASDVEALLDLIVRLRSKKPDLFINTSTGSWPSPFWLLYADSIWRQGMDTDMQGKGSQRQKWITYRDGQVLSGTLDRGPLFPVNALMIHGIFINHTAFGEALNPKAPRPTYDEGEITAEIRSFFGTGVNLQELYIAPDLMTPRTWDVLAEAARWSRRNADVLADTHHIGGNPLAGEVYGWASWTPKKAIITLRNPDDRPATFSLDVAQALELPNGTASRFALKSPWSEDASKPAVEVRPGQTHVFHLQPFEVLVFDATPVM